MDTMFSGESKNIEYKVTLPDKSEKYMKTIVAFANTQGGKLIVGIDDKTHQIVGVESDILFHLMELPMQFQIHVCRRSFRILSLRQ